MRTRDFAHARRREAGGITILVALMMLVLLTIASLAISKNGTRAAISAGELRQAYQAENIADTGIEWAIFWMAGDPNTPPTRPTATGNALALQNAMTTLYQGQQNGVASTTFSNSLSTTGSAATQGYDVNITYMGQVTPAGTGFTGAGHSIADPTTVQGLNLWSIRSTGDVAYPNGLTFQHRREAWVTIPPL